jgi:hypothetical protein
MHHLLRLTLAAAASLTIAACGGGGGSEGTSSFGPGAVGTGACAAASGASANGGASCVTASALTLVLSSSTVNNTGGQTVTATATASTASGQTVAGIPVTFSVDNNATFTATSSVTNASGVATATVSIGSDASNRVVTVTARSGGLSSSAPFSVTGSVLTATAVPAIVTPGSAGNKVDFRLVNSAGNPMVNQAITVTAGSLAPVTGTTGINGDYSYTYTAPTANGALDVVGTAGGVSRTQTVVVQGGNTTIPAAIGPILSASVSANPSVVSVNSTTSNNRTEIRALFVGGNNAPVRNVRVRFDLSGDANSVGGTFSTGTNVVYADANGIATTAYIPGSRSSPTNGVTIRACYDTVDFAASVCPNATTTTITVASDPLSVSIGSNAEIYVGSANLTYQRRFVVLVVDSSGRAVPNVDVIPSVDLERYLKGQYFRFGSVWVKGTFDNNGATVASGQLPAGVCANEDINRNAVREAAEDINGNGTLEPRKSDVAITVLGNGKTDASGTATVQIEYPQNVGSWLQVKILVAATGVAGTEGRATWTEQLPVPIDAINSAASPAFVRSPYGVVAESAAGYATPCHNPN